MRSETTTDFRIFISHSSHDVVAATAVCRCLESGGVRCWISTRDIPAGSDWSEEIIRSIRECSGLVFVWTPNSEASAHVRREVKLACNSGKLVVPMRFPETASTEDLNYYLDGIHQLQCDFSTIDATIPSVLDAIRKHHCSPEELEKAIIISDESNGLGELPDRPKAIQTLINNSSHQKSLLASFGRPRIVVTLVILLVFLICLSFTILNQSSKKPTTSQKPVVIGIYPSDGFGPLRKRGLHKSLDQFSADLTLIDLDSISTQDMKENKINVLLKELEKLLAQENVLAVVGPPITEATYPVLETIAKQKPDLPVIIESAGPPSKIGWDEFKDRLAIFRLHSGVDSRGANVASFILEGVKHNVKFTLLLDRNPVGGTSSYGELLYDEVKKNIENWDELVANNWIATIPFASKTIADNQDQFDRAFQTKQIVLMFGLGSDFKRLADEFYGTSSSPLAKFGGWMTGYSIDKTIDDYQASRIFEITDINISPSDVPSSMLAVFQNEFGALSPANRDQAFSFDAGLCLHDAYARTKHSTLEHANDPYLHPTIDRTFLKRISHEMRVKRVVGVSGEIRLDSTRSESSTNLYYCLFSKENKRWEIVSYQSILQNLQMESN